MSTRRVVVPLLAALLLTAPTPAAADSSPSPGERIARVLRTTPVYVDDAYAIPQARQRQLAAQVEATHLPIKVVLTPLTKGDAFNGDADVLATVVRDRLPQGDLILITTDGDFTDSLNGYEWPADTHQTADAVAAAGLLDETRNASLADLTSKAVKLVAEGQGTAVYEDAVRDLGVDAERRPGPAPDGLDGKVNGRSWPVWAMVALGVLTLAALASAVSRRRRRTPSPSVFATARAADESALRARAEAEVVALAESAQAADPAMTPGLRDALDAYAAAGTVLDEARGVPDLAGVLALVAEGEAALSGSTDPLPLCFFNPLHGRAARHMTWRPPGHRDRAQVAVCAACATALRARRSPEVLTDGESVPYFEVPGSFWAASGYGSLLRGGDSLAARVGRGEFTRSAGGAGRLHREHG
ncbi:hypothetical protein ACWD11_03605 [Streptomyces sp. NPDC002776]